MQSLQVWEQVAVVGAVVFLIAGLEQANLAPHSIGFVNILALIVVSPVSMLTAGLGVRWVHAMRPDILRWIFAVFLMSVVISMLFE